MIQIENINISHFRGIKDLDLNLAKNRFGVFGPNGTGKSGVVDAIEFVLTGSITRLTGAGTDELSVGRHGPHVDAGASSDKAIVKIEGVLTSTGEKVSIERSVAKPSKPKIEPNNEVTKTALSEIERHPEFALSRRDIVKYIITPAGKRDEDVKALLRLDRLDAIRKSLTTASNSASTNAKAAKNTAQIAQQHFAQGLGVADTKAVTILAAANKHRSTLQLAEISELSKKTNFKDGIKDGAAPKSAVPKDTALKEVQALVNELKSESDEQSTARSEAITALESLKADAKAWRTVRQTALVKAGIPLIDENGCPLCDAQWEEEELRNHLEQKLESAKAANEALSDIAGKVSTVSQQIQARITALNTAAIYAGQLKCENEQQRLSQENNGLKKIDEKLRRATNTDVEMSAALSVLTTPWAIAETDVVSATHTLKAEIEKLADVSEADKAEEQLILAQERYENWVSSVEASRKAAANADIAREAKETFEEISIKELNQIYEAVQNDFASYYKQLNKGDEEEFEGTLTPGPAKLNLNVDFYGRGKFPPGAFHSEGHQDGMGLCLYLALMKQTMGDDFRFCVLDDVLMSVDSGHRRQVCHLLLKEFPDTQFVLTTHDRVWLNFMRAEKLISRAVTFGGWTVDTGPLIYNDVDMMTRVREALDEGDVQSAAGRLRHYLEHVGYLLCDGLRAPVPFRGDGQYTLNDTLPQALAAIKKRLKQAKAAANSWGKVDLEQSIESTFSSLEKAVAQSKVTEWGVNPAVHFNAWENFEPKEFEKIVSAFDSVLVACRCKVCGSLMRLSYSGSKPQALNCICGHSRFDLAKKKSN